MPLQLILTRRRIVMGGLAFTLAGALLAVVVAASGIYNIAATRGHPFLLRAFLELGMRRSVEAHAGSSDHPELNDQNLITLGASHFQNSCATCHGSPAHSVSPVSAAMLPEPPLLHDKVQEWSDDELHWIVKHGLQYTGMPGWAGTERDDEVWALVAFLRMLPNLDEESYLILASGNSSPAITKASTLPLTETCARCHGTGTAPQISTRIPRLAGQKAAYLEGALHDYRQGRRESGFMEPVAVNLPEKRIQEIARYYAELESPHLTTKKALDTERIVRGQRLALQGDGYRLAACASCHMTSDREDYPSLAGQPEEYLLVQLALWRNGGRTRTPAGRLMAEIANNLSDRQAKDVSAFFASLPPPNQAPGTATQAKGEAE